jgi:hypothetical protein
MTPSPTLFNELISWQLFPGKRRKSYTGGRAFLYFKPGPIAQQTIASCAMLDRCPLRLVSDPRSEFH